MVDSIALFRFLCLVRVINLSPACITASIHHVVSCAFQLSEASAHYAFQLHRLRRYLFADVVNYTFQLHRVGRYLLTHVMNYAFQLHRLRRYSFAHVSEFIM